MKFLPENDSSNLGLCYAINNLVTKMRLSTMQSLRVEVHEDLTLEQYELLFVLINNNGVYQRQLSKLLLKDRANISRILKNLEKKKLIIKKTNPNNKKIQEIYITELGKQIVNYASPVKNGKAKGFLQHFSNSELEQLQRLIDKMHNNLNGMYSIST